MGRVDLVAFFVRPGVNPPARQIDRVPLAREESAHSLELEAFAVRTRCRCCCPAMLLVRLGFIVQVPAAHKVRRIHQPVIVRVVVERVAIQVPHPLPRRHRADVSKPPEPGQRHPAFGWRAVGSHLDVPHLGFPLASDANRADRRIDGMPWRRRLRRPGRDVEVESRARARRKSDTDAHRRPPFRPHKIF